MRWLDVAGLLYAHTNDQLLTVCPGNSAPVALASAGPIIATTTPARADEGPRMAPITVKIQSRSGKELAQLQVDPEVGCC